MAKDEEERRRNIPDPDLLPGHRIMPKSEQQETLKKLKDCKCLIVFSETISLTIKLIGSPNGICQSETLLPYLTA